MIRIVKISQEILLTLGAILGVICILAALAAVFFGVTPLIFRSGSMSPEIHTGALALAQEVPASEIRVADVISAINPQGTRVTHRVIAVFPNSDGTVALSMQGDANEVADPEPYVVTKADRVIWHLDGLGFVVQEVQKPPYVFGLGLLAGGLLVFAVRSRRAERLSAERGEPDTGLEPDADLDTETHRADVGGGLFDDPRTTEADGSTTPPLPDRRRKGAIVASTALVLVALVGTGTVVGRYPQETMALFTDSTGAVSASLASSLPVAFRPTAVTCAGTGSGVGRDLTITWTAPSTTPNDTRVTASPLAPVTVVPGGVTSVTYAEAVLTASGATSFSVVVAARHFTNWTAPAATFIATVNTSNNRKVTCSPA